MQGSDHITVLRSFADLHMTYRLGEFVEVVPDELAYAWIQRDVDRHGLLHLNAT